MTAHLVTFSDASMSRSAELCVESAGRHGVQWSRLWAKEDYQSNSICKANPLVFAQPSDTRRAWGWWAWKPDIIRGAMEGTSCQDGDILIYSDAGIEFINNVNYIIDRMDQDIFLFGNMYEHAHWCKRDIINEVCPLQYALDNWPRLYAWTGGSAIAINPEKEGIPRTLHWDNFGKQVQASVIFFRVNDNTRAFVKEWLDWCLFEGGRLIDDSPSRTPNHPEFQENRHDQAILTTMAYRDGIKLHSWPAQYNDGAFEYPRGDYPDEGYPILLHHHRKRNHEWEQVA